MNVKDQKDGMLGPFEMFVKGFYPMHFERIQRAQAGIRFCLLKGVLGTMAFFGLPISALIWGLGLFFEAQSHRLQDGQKPLPYVEYAQPVMIAAICLTLIACLGVGSILGWLKGKKCAFQVEQDQVKLRTEFFMREVLERVGARHIESSEIKKQAQALQDDPIIGGTLAESHAADSYSKQESQLESQHLDDEPFVHEAQVRLQEMSPAN